LLPSLPLFCLQSSRRPFLSMNSSLSELDLTEEDLSLRWLFQPMTSLREEINTLSLTCQFDPSFGSKFPLLAERGRMMIGNSNMSRDQFMDRIMKLPRLSSDSTQSSPISSTSSDNREVQTPSPISGTAYISAGPPVDLTPPSKPFSVQDLLKSKSALKHQNSAFTSTIIQPNQKRSREAADSDEEIDVG
ncbi:hypothetical protein PENTCL1PPCAC_2571, partial [Pristionchus entomophagus]